MTVNITVAGDGKAKQVVVPAKKEAAAPEPAKGKDGENRIKKITLKRLDPAKLGGEKKSEGKKEDKTEKKQEDKHEKCSASPPAPKVAEEKTKSKPVEEKKAESKPVEAPKSQADAKNSIELKVEVNGA